MSFNIDKAKSRLQELSKTMDSALFKRQYESLNYNEGGVLLEELEIEKYKSRDNSKLSKTKIRFL